VRVELDPAESANRTISVYGKAGIIPSGGTRENPLELFVGNAGTAARFLAALVCLGRGFYRLSGVPRMHQRPQGALFDALRQLGYGVEASGDTLPVLIEGGGPRAGECTVSIEKSSQFASALLLAGKTGGWRVRVVGENEEESAYVQMTRKLLATFPASGEFAIEPDASSGSYFLAAGALLRSEDPKCEVVVPGWPATGWQIDQHFARFLDGQAAEISRQRDLGDSILTAMILAPFGEHPVRFTDLGRLRLQECERVKAMRDELGKCGARVEENGDVLEIFPSRLHPAEIETYNDHRIAMCFATLGLKVPGMRIRNPVCVRKTFPNFFAKWAAPLPAGLQAQVLDARSRRPLQGEDLLAE
jgi:3-phosphoshikimate 1-carboxyvinyltransferase